MSEYLVVVASPPSRGVALIDREHFQSYQGPKGALDLRLRGKPATSPPPGVRVPCAFGSAAGNASIPLLSAFTHRRTVDKRNRALHTSLW